MTILVACEESQSVTTELRNLGHTAFSCDLVPCSGGHPEWHLQRDVVPLLTRAWDMVIAFPPCTHIAASGRAWFHIKRLDGRQDEGIQFFMLFTDLPHISRVAIENPIGIMSTIYRKPDQIIQPWMFGHGETKATCLWLKGLPLLQPTSNNPGRFERMHHLAPSPERAKIRSRTYAGVARAMAQQWTL